MVDPTLPYSLTHTIFTFSSTIHSLFTHTAAEKLLICQMIPKYSSNSYFNILEMSIFKFEMMMLVFEVARQIFDLIT